MKKLFYTFLVMLVTAFAMAQPKIKKDSKGNPILKKYRVVIAFTSHSSGIDDEKYQAITKYFQSHPKKPAYDEVASGMEGERNICSQLKKLKKSEQKKFIEELKKLAQGSDRVFINENAESVQKE